MHLRLAQTYSHSLPHHLHKFYKLKFNLSSFTGNHFNFIFSYMMLLHFKKSNSFYVESTKNTTAISCNNITIILLKAIRTKQIVYVPTCQTSKNYAKWKFKVTTEAPYVKSQTIIHIMQRLILKTISLDFRRMMKRWRLCVNTYIPNNKAYRTVGTRL